MGRVGRGEVYRARAMGMGLVFLWGLMMVFIYNSYATHIHFFGQVFVVTPFDR